MSYRISVGVPPRHIAPLSVNPANSSYPIPSWSAEFLPEDSVISKLKQLSLLHQTDLPVSLPSANCSPTPKATGPLLAFVCIGASLCLDAHPSSDSVLPGKLNLSNRVDGNAAKIGESPSHRFWSQLEEAIAPSATRAGKLANLQPANAAVIQPFHTKFIKPVEGYGITSAFGDRIHPIYGDVRFHEGVDIGTPSGVPVKASRTGQVTFADWNGGYGKVVIIQHDAGYETLYAHLDELLVKAGDRVPQGKVIGLSGSTGYVTGPHLHFEIRMNEMAQNPLNYL
jgi:hypothetical protein